VQLTTRQWQIIDGTMDNEVSFGGCHPKGVSPFCPVVTDLPKMNTNVIWSRMLVYRRAAQMRRSSMCLGGHLSGWRMDVTVLRCVAGVGWVQR
jgi:hypothetical protein